MPESETISKTGLTRGGRPSKKAAEALDLRILSEATRLFAANGFAATSMEQVVSACGAGKDTIYRRYASKTALFQAVLDHLRRHAVERLEAATPAEGPPLDRLSSFARQLLSINLDPQLLALHRISYGELIVFGCAPKLATADDPILQRFTALVSAAQEAGDMAPGDAAFIADQLLYAIAVKPTLAAMLDPHAFRDEGQSTLYFQRAWQLFMQGASI
ncbi:TetR/AcrR family transcriptional regulator [Aureimonas pseudogalii]|uniref:AcrR family transcriptional regulator n=1 Tax=Aureimonas pseudogalii TaxID=1744844 RepID=A0A7W6H807_9HYPH|nr:TetR/AcrR family transcriptional regulator [Aureimonas pseudogalii]MBB4000296.1 AcrR family transcriptional regulator [Aureimonas pseudogalii]